MFCILPTTKLKSERYQTRSHKLDAGNIDKERIMSRISLLYILPSIGLLIAAPCQAETFYPPLHQPSTTTYPQHYGYGGVAATPVPIPRPIYHWRYPTRYGPSPVAGLPIPIPAPSQSTVPSTAVPRYSGYSGVAATPVPIPRPIYQWRYPTRYGPNPVGGLPIPLPAPYYGN
jgi:hypothetical protein